MFGTDSRQRPSRRSLSVIKTAISAAIVAASVLFLIAAFRGSWSELEKIALYNGIYLSVFLLSIVYGSAYFLLAFAWHHTLRQMTPLQTPFAASASIYCLANIAKYVPGSVLHFAGRQILGARAGWKQGDIARATVIEIGANVLSVSGIILLAIAFNAAAVVNELSLAGWHTSSSALRVSLLSVLGVSGLVLFLLARSRHFLRAARISTPTFGLVLALNACFFSINLVMAMVLAGLVAIDSGTPLVFFGLAYLIAWLAGFVIPGAPGGIGVREGALVLLLAGRPGGEAAALALGIGMRAVTTFGDVISGAIGYWLGRSSPTMLRV